MKKKKIETSNIEDKFGLSKKKRKEIDKIVSKAVKEYGEVFRRLGKE